MIESGGARRPPPVQVPRRSSGVDPTALAGPLRGRGPEAGILAEVLDRVATGQPALALIEGEAGIGKTRLLDSALEDARGRGMQVVRGRAEELEQTRPFGLVAAAFGCERSAADPRRAAIGELLASPMGGGGPVTVTSDPGLRFRAVDAFADLAEALALAEPLVIGVDDLQWADPSSLLTLGAVARRMAGLPAALLGCLRPLPHSTDLDRLTGVLEGAGARRIWLGPLPDTAVRDLVADAVAAEPGSALLVEAAGAGGNPLFVTELVGALLQEGTIRVANGRAEVARAALPPTLRLTILRRLSFLPEPTVQALRAASVLGSGFSLTDLATITGSSALELLGALDGAVRAGVIEDDGPRLRFRHDLIRDAVYQDLPGSVRLALHREAGQRLAAVGASTLQVAEHLARAATPGDAEAIRWLTQAAREAMATSPDAAASLLARAADVMDPADPGRDTLLAEQAGSLLSAGRLAQAETVCRMLLADDHDPSVTPAARIYLSHALLADGRACDALRELERAASSAAPGSAELTVALAVGSFARLNLGDLDGAWSAAAAAQSADSPTGGRQDSTAAMTSVALAAEQHASLAMTSQALATQLRGDLSMALKIADNLAGQGRVYAARAGQRHMYPVLWVRGLTLIELDRLDEARSTLQASIRHAEKFGVQLHLPSYQVFLAVERFTAGDWDDALTEAQAGLELAEEIGHSFARVYGQAVRSLILLHRNDLPGARRAVDAAEAELASTGPRYRSPWARWARALVLETEGQVSDAYAVLSGCWDWCARHGLELEYRVLGPDLIRLALAAHDAERAQSVAAAVAGLAGRNQVPSLAGAALRCQGLADGDAEMLAAAARACQPGTRPLELAGACEDAGAAYARRGDPDRARPLLEQALEIYEQLDAGRDLARAEAVARGAGMRRGRRGARGRPKSGWASLTPAEQAVAGLVADGLTNPQIGARLYISRRTVQTHLVHVFAKLDIASRAQLAAQVTRHQ
jgi:DNA-binding CsgD family transcriptional regulator/tetratricopeptide (TPR) repeat protein